MQDTLEQRIIDLEIHVAHQAETVEALNDVVSRQSKTIDKLVMAMKQMRDQMLDLQDLVDQAPDNQKPPHY
ncbi:SlyX family protein [Rhodobacteraceae bacterium RKSG542]|uniref:SlyX family protein n=1 Tax=Pseudovibrio flavus TaxID=2529854 RepID=UPI0012BD667F|nr:SlyX family protein [Pseudovibrio flavus]MTI16753.1 SlyX family protein [Pseudovibrio flavus]